MPFVEGLHPETRAYINDRGIKKCQNAFRKIVEIGEVISLNERKIADGVCIPGDDALKSFGIRLYASKHRNPILDTDEDNTYLGKMAVNINDSSVPRHKRHFKICGIFGQTEIKMEILEIRTGEVTKAIFDAL